MFMTYVHDTYVGINSVEEVLELQSKLVSKLTKSGPEVKKWT